MDRLKVVILLGIIILVLMGPVRWSIFPAHAETPNTDAPPISDFNRGDFFHKKFGYNSGDIVKRFYDPELGVYCYVLDAGVGSYRSSGIQDIPELQLDIRSNANAKKSNKLLSDEN